MISEIDLGLLHTGQLQTERAAAHCQPLRRGLPCGLRGREEQRRLPPEKLVHNPQHHRRRGGDRAPHFRFGGTLAPGLLLRPTPPHAASRGVQTPVEEKKCCGGKIRTSRRPSRHGSITKLCMSMGNGGFLGLRKKSCWTPCPPPQRECGLQNGPAWGKPSATRIRERGSDLDPTGPQPAPEPRTNGGNVIPADQGESTL